jgi:hypothetical protein
MMPGVSQRANTKKTEDRGLPEREGFRPGASIIAMVQCTDHSISTDLIMKGTVIPAQQSSALKNKSILIIGVPPVQEVSTNVEES